MLSAGGTTRIPTAAAALQLPSSPRVAPAHCSGMVQGLLADGSVMASFGLQAQGGQGSHISGFQAKVRHFMERGRVVYGATVWWCSWSLCCTCVIARGL